MAFWVDLLLTALWGGLLSLERRAFLQAMFSRPLVAALGTGFFVHDVQAGVYIGLVFELFHLGSASLGGSHPDHETLPSVMAVAFAAALGHASGSTSTLAIWAIAILLMAPMGPLGAFLEGLIDERARKYAGRAQTALTDGDMTQVGRQNLRAMWPQFVVFGLLSGLGLVLGYALVHQYLAIPLNMLRGFAWAYPALGSVAAAIAVRGSHARGRMGVAFAAAVVTAALATIHFLRTSP